MTGQRLQHEGSLFGSIAFALMGLLLLLAGGALFASRLAIAGYGIWIFVWGLAFLVGAFSRYAQARA